MPRGLKPVRKTLADGSVRLYWYHRATGKRLQHDPTTADGLLEVRALDGRAKAQAAVVDALGGSYALLWAKYRESPEWRALKPRTRSDYQAVRDWLGDAATQRRLVDFTTPRIFKLRDKAAAQRGRRFGNYVVQVLRLTFAWGKKRGHCPGNPAETVELIRRPAGARKVNRPWSTAEVEAFLNACPPQLAVPFALGLCAGMREGDALRITWRAYDRGELRWTASKNGQDCAAPVGGVLRELLDYAKARRGAAVQIAVNGAGAPWSESGFRASFFKRVRNLTEAGALRPGCTFHGLRHTIVTGGRDGGESDFRLAAGIGDRSTAVASIYGRDADRESAQLAVLGDTQKRFANIEWKPPAT